MRETVEIMFCDNCGAVIDCEEYTDGDGNAICEGCFYEYYHICDNCGGVTDRDDLISFAGGREYVCEDCAECYYYRCDDCGEYVSLRRLWAERNVVICDFCSDNYCICDDCDEIIRSDRVHYMEGHYYCDDCEPSHRSIIHDYNYKPVPTFYGELSDTVKGYYGLELEIDDGEYKHDAARAIQDACGDCI